MKTRGSWVNVLKCAGVTVLVSGLLLLGAFRNLAKRAQPAGEGRSHFTAGETARLSGAKVDPRWIEAYGKLPLSFEENVGQTAQEVRYVSHGSGYELFLTPKEAVLALRAPVSHDLSPLHRFETVRALREALRTRTMTAVRMRFEGANPATQIRGTDELLKKTNYFIGSDPRKWRADVPSYGRVKYADIYPGVDLVFYGNQRQLEYDFVVAPGADPKAIRLDLEGARKLRISARGDVILSVPGGEVVLQKPVVYQMVKGERHEIAGRYALVKNHQVTFSVPSYDRSEPLILDPVLNYSTYLGGSSFDGDSAVLGIAVDSTGNAFVAGTTFSTDFPTTSSGFDPGPPASGAASGAVFVTEMNPTGTAELYSTYLAGSTGEYGVALALDPSGKIYVTGLTFSSDFPTTSNALKQSPNVANFNVGTSFISKIDPSISGPNSLVYSSYIGGTGGTPPLFTDFGNGITADASGNAYVTGITLSSPGNGITNFPVTAGAFQSTLNSTFGNAFLTRIDTTKSGNASLIYSTYLGGAGANAGNLKYGDAGFGVAVDSSSNAYIVGATSSTDFPTTTSGFKTTSPAGNVNGTGFVAKIDTTKSLNASLVYSTYLGGEVSDKGFGIALGPSNVAYTTGTTDSLLFPTTTGAFQTTGNANGAAFVSLVDTGKTGAASLPYSTYLGGTATTTGSGIRADGTGNAYVVGSTAAPDFPVTPGALEPVYPGANANGFVSKISPSGNGAADLVYSTFFGGSGNGKDLEQGFAIALDASNPSNAYITGETFSTASSFPVFPPATASPPAFQTNLKGPSDAFVAKLTLIPTLVVSPTSLNFGTILIPNTSAPQSVTLTNNTNAVIAFTSATLTNGNPAAATTDYVISANTCVGNIPSGVPPANQCTISVTFKPLVVGAETATLVLADGDSTSPQNISLTGSGTNTPPNFGLTGPTSVQNVTDGSTLNFNVTVTGVGGFSSPVALACTGAPALATCTVSPSSVTPPTVSPFTVPAQVSMTTTALFVPPTRVPTPTVPWRQVVPLVLALMLLLSLRWARRPRLRLAMAAAMFMFIAIAGCSGPPKPHTPKGPATLTITGTSGALTHAVQVQISVN